jgi:PTS system nitrogen regulatory IIA component
MDEQQVAAYLHMDARDVIKMASRGQIPCRKVGGRFVFNKGPLEHWIEQGMHQMDGDRLAGIEKGVRSHHGMTHGELEVIPLIPPEGFVVPLTARSRDSVIRNLVGTADKCGLVFDPDDLIANVRQREELCSTALAPNVALPHPHTPLPNDIDRSFIVVGLTPSGIPYGAEDGGLTRLFFLICCKDERTHLHVLARLARMLCDKQAVASMIECGDAKELSAALLNREKQVIGEPEA